MEKVIDLEYRMYGLVPYNLSPIQQGIQYGHAVVEYINNNLQDACSQVSNPLVKWMEYDKTFIILNGGTTNSKGDPRQGHGGTLNQHFFTLSDNKVKCATFYEPDLGDQLTAVVFLVDERVWDKEKYPDYGEVFTYEGDIDGQTEDYLNWVDTIGEKNVWLRKFLKQFRLA